MQLFYNPELTEQSTQVTFSKDESKHIVKVLRKAIGDELHITNGKGWLFVAKITLADVKNCMTDIVSKTFHPKKNYQLHLAVAPTKMNDRYEWFLEKTTEIGIDSITPIICSHSERKTINPERFEKILLAAMKQSNQYYLPTLQPQINFQEFIKQTFNSQKFIAHCEETQKTALKNVLKTEADVLILIGPEGDFSVKEIETAIKNQFIPVTLGETRLRTETAAIVACHSVAYINE
jgi:16S rRNA (uracil1498-N3)-methyltransferase